MMNFLNALHLVGYAAKVLSGASVRDPDIFAAFCDDDEQLAAWVVIGSATRAAHPRPPLADRPRPLYGAGADGHARIGPLSRLYGANERG